MPFIKLAIVLFPLLELAILLKVGGLIGVFPTLALLVLGVLWGGILIRAAGPVTLLGLQRGIALGQRPETEMLRGASLFLAGVLLAIPGFLSDVLATLLILPLTRDRLIGRLLRGIQPNRGEAAGHTPATLEGKFKRHS